MVLPAAGTSQSNRGTVVRWYSHHRTGNRIPVDNPPPEHLHYFLISRFQNDQVAAFFRVGAVNGFPIEPIEQPVKVQAWFHGPAGPDLKALLFVPGADETCNPFGPGIETPLGIGRKVALQYKYREANRSSCGGRDPEDSILSKPVEQRGRGQK
jgi:hypothetical protein